MRTIQDEVFVPYLLASKSVWLNNLNGLFPESGKKGEQNEAGAVVTNLGGINNLDG
jgi:hypothetical protein